MSERDFFLNKLIVKLKLLIAASLKSIESSVTKWSQLSIFS